MTIEEKREKNRLRAQRYREANREKVREYNREYWRAHADEFNARRKTNKQEIAELKARVAELEAQKGAGKA